MDSGILFRNYSTTKKLHGDFTEPKDQATVRGVWYTGPPGVGKTHLARTTYPGAFIKSQNKWWDGYLDQKYVILDDFDT